MYQRYFSKIYGIVRKQNYENKKRHKREKQV